MFNTPIEIPDQISTLDLSKIWLYKALQELEKELQAGEHQDSQETSAEDEDSSC